MTRPLITVWPSERTIPGKWVWWWRIDFIPSAAPAPAELDDSQALLPDRPAPNESVCLIAARAAARFLKFGVGGWDLRLFAYERPLERPLGPAERLAAVQASIDLEAETPEADSATGCAMAKSAAAVQWLLDHADVYTDKIVEAWNTGAVRFSPAGVALIGHAEPDPPLPPVELCGLPDGDQAAVTAAWRFDPAGDPAGDWVGETLVAWHATGSGANRAWRRTRAFDDHAGNGRRRRRREIEGQQSWTTI